MKVKIPAPKKATKRTKPAPIEVSGDIELWPDGWERFEGLVKRAAKLGPMPHTKGKTKAK